jgi:hypothetical protein
MLGRRGETGLGVRHCGNAGASEPMQTIVFRSEKTDCIVAYR